MITARSWDAINSHRNEKGSTVVAQYSQTNNLNGHRYKQWLRSLAKPKQSGPSIQKKRKLAQIVVNVIKPESSSEDKTTNAADSSVSHSQQEWVGFMLRRVNNSNDAEESNISNHATQTKQQRNNISESQCNMDGSKLQEKFTCSTADEPKSTTTKFLEYWVPVRLTNIQTEQYCGSLFSNSNVLCSYNKNDPTETLHELLVSTRKCCDHPYLVDMSVRESFLQGIPEPEQLDAEIKLSSKLMLLYKILLEIYKRGLRVLILYQSFRGSGLISSGDILDDIIHEKFGEDSFVRIGEGLSKSRKRAVLNTFNDKGSEKFVCLMETRACLPSTELKSIDTVIFFNSDLDPISDLRALQKINLESQFKQVKVFRLYSAYTVEEKVLMLAKQGLSPEANIVNMKRSTCHGLLSWGAFYLFQKLDEFHNFTTCDTNSMFSYGKSSVEDVLLELSTLLPNNDESSMSTKNSFILEVQPTGGTYSGNISLLGEVEYPLMDGFSLVEEMMVKEPPYVFWLNLFQGRNPRWKYFSSQSPRTRKCVQRFEDLFEASVGASKKCWGEARGNSLGGLQGQDKERMLPGEAAERTIPPMLGDPSSTELYSLLLPEDHDQMPSSTTIQNDIPQETTSPGFKTVEAPQRSAEISSNLNEVRREPSASTQVVTHSAVKQSVCKALQIELEALQKQKTESLEQHENMKLQMKKSCEAEIDQIQKKYEMQLRNAEMAFAEKKKALETRYNQVFINKSLAETILQRENSDKTTSSQGNLLTTFSGNLQPCHQMRAPAPHLRSSKYPMPYTTSLLSSRVPENIFALVRLSKVTSNIQAL